MIRTQTPQQADGARLEVRFASDAADLRAAQRLRYDVFVEELGGSGPLVDHENRLEADRFDPFFDHLLLCDPAKAENSVVGVYRLMRRDQARAAGQFYCDDEYDLTVLKRSGRQILELGRSCLHKDYRGGIGMMLMWSALSDYVQRHKIDVLFGVASFHGTEVAPLAQALSFLHHRHLAPPELRVRARAQAFQPMDLIAANKVDRLAATRAIPALIKGYLRLGGVVGEGAFIDRPFNTTDICLLLDAHKIPDKRAGLYSAKGGRA